jgi:RNA polymerase sigma-70 factor (ECF subfamily)
MDEQALIGLAQAGQKEAFREIFEVHKKRIFSLAYQYLQNVEDAEDAMQDAFIKAYHSLPKYNRASGVNFSSWLCRISVNTSIDLMRKRKIREASPLEDDAGKTVNSNDSRTNPESAAHSQEIREKIDHVLRRLSPRQRMIFILRHYQEFKIREIAEYLNLSEGNVKRQLFRAIGALKEHLKNFLLENAP